MKFKSITQSEFYKSMGNKDVVLKVVGNPPYTVEFRMRGSGDLVGKSVERLGEDNEDYEVTEFYKNN